MKQLFIWTCLTACLLSVYGYSTQYEESNHIPLLKKFPKKTSGVNPFRRLYSLNEDLNLNEQDKDDPGEPLYLTKLLKAGKIKEARSKSRVKLGHRYGTSFSGFFTVNELYDSNMFMWYFPSRFNTSSAPLVIWLQGGPGGSSLFGLFTENGPFYVNEKMELLPREYSWNRNLSVLYIDNPVGTGFSFTKNEEGYAENEADVGVNLFNVLLQFYEMFPEVRQNDLYITGESYAGKYVPALAYVIHKMNKNSKYMINLKGIAIGDGFCDPISMTDYGDLLYEISLIDTKTKQYFNDQAALAIKYIQQQQFVKAFDIFNELLDGDLDTKSYYTNVTGLKNYYNFLMQDEPKDLNYWNDFINRGIVRREINVGNATFNSGVKVEEHLKSDIMKSVKPWVETLMDSGYKVMLYNGQLDIIVAPSLTDNFIKSLKWKGADGFKNAPRKIWKLFGEVGGYYKVYENFYQVVVRNAGHLVPYDQPKWAFELIMSLVVVPIDSFDI